MIYCSLYKSHCNKAFQFSYGPQCSRYLDREVQTQCDRIFEALEDGYTDAAQLHRGNAQRYSNFLRQVVTNTVCIWCLCRPPERHLSCGHSICDTCAALFGIHLPKSDSQVRIDCLFDDGGELLVNIKPPTAGVRIIGIDGGGARGVTPLEFLGELQKLLGDCPIHDMIDLAVGTSSGESSIV